MAKHMASARIPDEASANDHARSETSESSRLQHPPAQSSTPSRCLRTKEVAHRTGDAVGTLRNWVWKARKTGELRGPRFVITETGAVRYLESDVEEYMNRFRPVGAAA